jgi:hypothetical protein
MMLKYFKYIFVYLFASYFLMAGAGYNVVNYCCQVCADKGINAVSTSSCFAIHHHTHASQDDQLDDLTCTNLNHHSENCHLFRLSTDIPSFQKVSQLNFTQIQPVDLFIPFSIFLTEKTELFVQNNIPPPDVAVQRTGRAILAFHAVLLI